jgi:hypothetical protein
MRIKLLLQSSLATICFVSNAPNADPLFLNIGGFYVCQTEFRLVTGEMNVPEPHYHAQNFSYAGATYQAVFDSSGNISGAQMLDPNAPHVFVLPADAGSVPPLSTPAFLDPNPLFEGYGLQANLIFAPLPTGSSLPMGSGNMENPVDSSNFSDSIDIRNSPSNLVTPFLQNSYVKAGQFVNNNNLFNGSFTSYGDSKYYVASLNGFGIDTDTACCGIGDPLSQWDYTGPEYECGADGNCGYDFFNTSQPQINEAKQKALNELTEVQSENREFIADLDASIAYWQGVIDENKFKEETYDTNLSSYLENEGWAEWWDDVLTGSDEREVFLSREISLAQSMQEYAQNKINGLNAEKTATLARHAKQEEELKLAVVRTDPLLTEIWTNRNNQVAISAARELEIQNRQNNAQITAHEEALAAKDTEIATAIENDDWDRVKTLQNEREKITKSLEDIIDFGQRIVFSNGKQLHLVYRENAGSGFGYTDFTEMIADLQSQGIDFRQLSEEEQAQVRRAAASGAIIAEGSLRHADPLLNIFDNPGNPAAWGSFYYDYYIGNAVDLYNDPALFFTRSWAYYKGVGYAIKDGVVDLAVLVYYLGHLEAEIYQNAFNYVLDTDIRIVDNTVTDALGAAYASIDEVSFDAYSEFVYVNTQTLTKALGREFEKAAGSGEAGIEKAIQGTGYVFTTIIGGEEIAFRAISAGVKGYKVYKLGKVIGKGEDGLTIARGAGVVSDLTPGQIADLQNAFEQGHAIDGGFTLDQLIAAEKKGLLSGGVGGSAPVGDGVPVLAGVLVGGADAGAPGAGRIAGAGGGIGGGNPPPIRTGFAEGSLGSSGSDLNPIDSGIKQPEVADAPYNPLASRGEAPESPAKGWNKEFDGLEIQLSPEDLAPSVQANFGLNVLIVNGKKKIAPVGSVILPDGTRAMLHETTYIHQGSTSVAYHALDETGTPILRNGKPVIIKLTKNSNDGLDRVGYELLTNAGLDPSKVDIPEWHSANSLPDDPKLGEYSGGLVSVIDEAPTDFSRQTDGRNFFTPEELTAYEVGARELESKGIIIFDNKADNFYFKRGDDGRLVLGLNDPGSALKVVDPITGKPDPIKAAEIRELLDSGNYPAIPQSIYDNLYAAAKIKNPNASPTTLHNKVMREWRHEKLSTYDGFIDWTGTGYSSLYDFPFVPSYLGRPDGRFPGVQTLAIGDVSKMTDDQLYAAMKGQGMTDAEIDEFINLPEHAQNAILQNPHPSPADIIAARRLFLAEQSPEAFGQWLRNRGIPEDEIDWMDEINPVGRDGALREYESSQRQASELADLENAPDSAPIENPEMSDDEFRELLREQGLSASEIEDYMNQPNEPLLLSEELADSPGAPSAADQGMLDLNEAVIEMDSSHLDVPPLMEGDGLAARYPMHQRVVKPENALIAMQR